MHTQVVHQVDGYQQLFNFRRRRRLWNDRNEDRVHPDTTPPEMKAEHETKTEAETEAMEPEASPEVDIIELNGEATADAKAEGERDVGRDAECDTGRDVGRDAEWLRPTCFVLGHHSQHTNCKVPGVRVQ